MSFLKGSTWEPVMTRNTSSSTYWLNWRVLLCVIWLIIPLVFSFLLIFKYECPLKRENRVIQNNTEPEEEDEDDDDDDDDDDAGILYEDEVWRPCFRAIHPAWLLAFRVLAFSVLVGVLALNVAVDGGDIFYYYTQWTFTLITIYFGLGSILSMYGCYQFRNRFGGNAIIDAEIGTSTMLSDVAKEEHVNLENRKIAGFWAYFFQIIFQMNAGAVILTDCVFWLIFVPFLEIENHNLNFFIIDMHTINAILLLVDTSLNSLRFPWFRISYFVIWTVVYVIFQWIVHVCVPLWWPYPFLDLSSTFAPLWYVLVALMHIPCYGVFVLIMKLKYFGLSKWFPDSYAFMKR